MKLAAVAESLVAYLEGSIDGHRTHCLGELQRLPGSNPIPVWDVFAGSDFPLWSRTMAIPVDRRKTPGCERKVTRQADGSKGHLTGSFL